MKMNEKTQTKKTETVVKITGITFLQLLQIVFIILKLCGYIDWSWPLVLLPIMISAGFSVLSIILPILGLIIFHHWLTH